MADLPPYTTPRWVKIAGIIVLVLVLLFGVLQLTGLGGEHGPGRHMPSGDTGSRPHSSHRAAFTSFDDATGRFTPSILLAVRQL